MMATVERLNAAQASKYRAGSQGASRSQHGGQIEYRVHDPLPMIASDGFGF